MYRAVGIVFGLLSFGAPAQAQDRELKADQVRDVFRKYCIDCHSGGKKTRGELNLFSSNGLVRADRPLVKPTDPDHSHLMQLVECGTMPPGTRPKVPDKERKILRDWIAAGAYPFPPESSEQYALTKILLDVRAAKEPGRNLADERYVTLNHLLADDSTAAELDLHRAALNKALNQLSTKKDLVTLKPIDPAATIYRIKLSELGWDVTPFVADVKNANKDIDPTKVNLYDLLLLDYPLATLPEHSDAAESIVVDYLTKVNLVRPIPYVRGDWLACVATQAPLYNDLLRLPLTSADLERRLDLGDGIKRARAALTASKVVRDNRLVERRSTDQGAYWRTYDFTGKQGMEALLADAGASNAGGAAIFRLPNGLPGYFITDRRNVRVEALPTANLHDKVASEGGVRAGLSCMICHDRGLVKVKNAWGNDQPKEIKALQDLYPDNLGQQLDKDNEGFTAALRQTLLGLTESEPLGPVSRRYRQEMAHQEEESSVTLVNLDAHPRMHAIWDASYVYDDQHAPHRLLARGAAPLPQALPPLDAVGIPRVAGKDATVSFELTAVNVKTNKAETAFRVGDTMAVVVKNSGDKPLYFELIVTDDQGGMLMIPVGPDKALMGIVQPGKEYRFAPGGGIAIKIKEGELTKQSLIVYAADEAFPPGIVLNPPAKPTKPGDPPKDYDPRYRVGGRIVHPLFKNDVKKIASKMVRQTIQIETLID